MTSVKQLSNFDVNKIIQELRKSYERNFNYGRNRKEI
jgi:hypothetical protein